MLDPIPVIHEAKRRPGWPKAVLLALFIGLVLYAVFGKDAPVAVRNITARIER